jgi:archaellin
MKNRKYIELVSLLHKAKHFKIDNSKTRKGFDIEVIDNDKKEDNIIEFQDIKQLSDSFEKILNETELVRLTENVKNDLNSKNLDMTNSFKIKILLS